MAPFPVESPARRANACARGGARGAAGSGLRRFVLEDYGFADFPDGARVLDVGCGAGDQLHELSARGCRGIGLDPDWPAVRWCAARGLRVLQARGEGLPVRAESLDGLICKVVLPYTDEARIVAEVGRVLKRGAQGRLCCQGVGYSLWYVVCGSSWRQRVYGLRTLVNTWLYALLGCRLPGFLGDTLYQSRRRLTRYYARHGLRLESEVSGGAFLGLPVFLYHSVRKSASEGPR